MEFASHVLEGWPKAGVGSSSHHPLEGREGDMKLRHDPYGNNQRYRWGENHSPSRRESAETNRGSAPAASARTAAKAARPG